MNIASIDIGSNTILLLIAKIENNKLITIENYYEMPRLSKGLLPGKNIEFEKVNLLLKILNNYKIIINKNNCEIVLLVATNALRIAKNNFEIVNLVKEQIGFDIEIIEGEKEAYYSFLGALSAADNNNQKVVIDIGGGSTEIIFGNEGNIEFRKSFPFGVVSLTEKFLPLLPPNKNQIHNLEEYLRNELSVIKTYKKDNITAIAVAGTPTSLSCINQNLKTYNDEKVEGSKLLKSDIPKLFDTLSVKSGSEIKNTYGSIMNGREDVILAGTIILKIIMEILDLDEFIVSSKGLRYGVILDYINNYKFGK